MGNRKKHRDWNNIASGTGAQSGGTIDSRFNMGQAAGDQIPDNHILLSDIKIQKGHNPRKRKEVLSGLEELVESMRHLGQLEEIVVRPNPDGPGFLLVSGERRFESARKLRWHTMRAHIMDATQLPPDKIGLAALVENLQQKPMTSDDIALAVDAEVIKGYETKSEIAKKLGKPNSWVTDCLAHAQLLKEFPFIRGRSMASSVAYRFKIETKDLGKKEKEAALRRLLKLAGETITRENVIAALAETDEGAAQKNKSRSSRTKGASPPVDYQALYDYPKWQQLPKATQRKCKQAYATYARARRDLESSTEELQGILPKKYWK